LLLARLSVDTVILPAYHKRELLIDTSTRSFANAKSPIFPASAGES
jgi:hypothetical protein